MAQPPTDPQPLFDFVQVTKRYPGVTALDGVSFQLMPGEVHVLFGENGAGKSTLISLMAGVQQPSEGEMRFRGEPVRFHSVHEARERGVSAVFQEFSLVPSMTVEENLFLGAETTRHGLLDKSTLRRRARELLDRLGFDLSPTANVGQLSRAEQQMVEIAKAFRAELSVLILDEPTASLTERETDRLFALVEQVKAQGVGIVYVTHRMREIGRIGDRVTVLRDGRKITTVDAAATDEDELVRLMTGRVIGEIFPTVTARPGPVRLEIEGLSTVSGSVVDASLFARAGEIVGLAGLVGSGKSEVLRAAFGLEKIAAGRVRLDGADVTGLQPKKLLRRGLLYLPPDRRDEGLLMMRSCRENISLAALDRPDYAWGPFIDRTGEQRETTRIAEAMQLHPMRPERAVDAFSGGNQQKVLIARSLTRPVEVFVFDEPTVGVDVGTRAAIYRFLRDLCEGGAAVVLISSDLPEILHLAHRAYVFYRGRIQAVLEGEAITEERVLSNFFEREAA